MSQMPLADWPLSEPILKLPYPYHTPYFVFQSSKSHPVAAAQKLFQLRSNAKSDPGAKVPPTSLHHDQLFFTEPEDVKSSERPPESNNTPWGRARRSPVTVALWEGNAAPSVAQAWLLAYVLFTIRPDEESIRVKLVGSNGGHLAEELKALMLAIHHPVSPPDSPEELLFLRGTFWQGAGSPFGPRPVWLPEDPAASGVPPVSTYPLTPFDFTTTSEPGTVHCWHPRRPVKPCPGSVIYSRYIPHLKETFSMVALDLSDAPHLDLFHTWQNDPRVSQGWNETGTLEQHREYLRRMASDPHQFAVLAAFDGVFFAYFEVYWAPEDRLGAYYHPEPYDRGRHSLVGDVRYRGAHRVGAWWSGLMHYLFLDEPRTMRIVGEPKASNSSVLAYDLVHGFSVDKFVDLPHKRSALMRCGRERFFQICPIGGAAVGDGKMKVVGGTGIGLVPKL